MGDACCRLAHGWICSFKVLPWSIVCQLQAGVSCLQVQLCGGRVSQAIEEGTTQLLLLDQAVSGGALLPRQLLQLVKDSAGGIEGLEKLRERLLSGHLKIVNRRCALHVRDRTEVLRTQRGRMHRILLCKPAAPTVAAT